MGMRTSNNSNVFPQSIAEILSSIFNINNDFNPDLMKFFQEIIDTIDIGVNTIVDETPDFIPLDKGRYSVINEAGFQELKSM